MREDADSTTCRSTRWATWWASITACDRSARRLLTGSHYDTVRNGGKYDGRLGILVPMACVRELRGSGRRLPFDLEVVGFAEEEGQRYKAVFLGSGRADRALRPALARPGRTPTASRCAKRWSAPGCAVDDIPKLERDATRYLGFVEVHIEQGPVLNDADLPLGIVTSINGSVRYVGEVIGMASHAGTTPMNHRRDAAAAVAELVLYRREARRHARRTSSATVGMLEVPNGSINVVPGRCRFSLDIRATIDAVRDACAADVLAELARICERRGVRYTLEETMRAAAAPSAAAWQRALGARGRTRSACPCIRMPSGAGHDAMKLHEVMPQAMLFVRGRTRASATTRWRAITNDDAELAVRAFQHLLEQLAADPER